MTTLEIACLIWIISLLVVITIAFVDNFLYPVCPSCEHNLYSRRLSFFSPDALCKKHGTFIIALAHRSICSVTHKK